MDFCEVDSSVDESAMVWGGVYCACGWESLGVIYMLS